MAKIHFIFQAAKKVTHADAIKTLLAEADSDVFIASVAYLREAGVAAVEEALQPIAHLSTFYVGIRNKVTTVQAIKRLLSLKVRVVAVDTASSAIFHPKIYLITAKRKAKVIVGSANLTFSGIHNNIEASALIELSLSDKADKDFVDEIRTSLIAMQENHPQHVFDIPDAAYADLLLEGGRLSDEEVLPAYPSIASSKGGVRDGLRRMKLNYVAPPALRVAKKLTSKQQVVSVAASKSAASIKSPPIPKTEYYLVWESKELRQRDLNIPKGTNTHPTGSMSLDKGRLDGIDHRHYFRDEVFAEVAWVAKAKSPHLSTAVAAFELVIKSINYGTYNLKITHNSNKNSGSYKQRNSMTSLHWGEAKPLIAKDDLLGRSLLLSRKDTKPPSFLIEID